MRPRSERPKRGRRFDSAGSRPGSLWLTAQLRYADRAVRSRSDNGRRTGLAFSFKLEHEDGTPADPPTLASAVPDWRPAMRFLGRAKTLRVVEIRDDDANQPPTLVVEDLVRAGH
jgi:hypothetical protein